MSSLPSVVGPPLVVGELFLLSIWLEACRLSRRLFMAKETLNIFLLFKVEGSSMHIVLLVLWILTYIQCVYLYFLHVLFSLLCLGILEVKEFLLFFLRICARHPLH